MRHRSSCRRRIKSTVDFILFYSQRWRKFKFHQTKIFNEQLAVSFQYPDLKGEGHEEVEA